MATQFVTTVTMTASPTRFTTSDIPCSYMVIQAHPGNAAAVFVGDSTTLAATPVGFKMAAPASNIPPDPLIIQGGPSGANTLNLKDWYVDSTSASQKVTVIYIVN